MFSGADFDPPTVQTRKALLLIDFQKDFTAPEGKLPVADADALITRVATVAHGFQNAGEIVWVTTEYQGPRETISQDTGAYGIILPRFLVNSAEAEVEEDDNSSDPVIPASPSNDQSGHSDFDREAFLADLPENDLSRCCVKGSKGAEVTEQLAQLIDPSRHVCIVKSDYSAFAAGSLVLSLRAKLVTELYLCGPFSHISVYATALDAIRHGFTVNILEDCVSHGNAECHEEALRQLGDIFGAELITGDELLEELKGSSPIHHVATEVESHYANNPAAACSSDSLTLRPKVERWMSELSDDGATQAPAPELGIHDSQLRRKLSVRSEATAPKTALADTALERSSLSSTSPPRKRSTGDRDTRDGSPVIEHFLNRRRSVKAPRNTHAAQMDPHPTRRRRIGDRRRGDSISSSGSLSVTGQSLPSANKISPPPPEMGFSPRNESSTVSPTATTHKDETDVEAQCREQTKQDGMYGEGDSSLFIDFLSDADADNFFECLKSEVQWQKMHHRSGEVPRLVAVQGQSLEDDSIPIYRHPADQSPTLLPWSPTVDRIRHQVEKCRGQLFNHVLIQFYRGGEDSISEHSDKTLDIVRGTDIVNVSLGAQRTMVLRTKKLHQQEANARQAKQEPPTKFSSQSLSTQGPRKTERVPLPHGSLFLLGPATNQLWLHSIRADKRRTEEKAMEELAFGGQRISLTFRLIGTYINPTAGLIWGQGAKSKLPGIPGKISKDPGEVERLITAFGEENHQADDFHWEKTYGQGSDVVNFAISDSLSQASTGASPQGKTVESSISSERYTGSTILSLSTDPIANIRVKVLLAYANAPYVIEPVRLGNRTPVLFMPLPERKRFKRVQGYEQIVSQCFPALSTYYNDEAGENLRLWREYRSKSRSEHRLLERFLAGLTKCIKARRKPLPEPNGYVSLADRDLWFILHEVVINEGGIQVFSEKVLEDFYRSVARTGIFSEALGDDLYRFIGE